MPSLKSVAESDAFLDPSVKPASSRVFIDTIPVIQQVPSISTWPEIEDAAERILEAACTGASGQGGGRAVGGGDDADLRARRGLAMAA